MPIKIKINLTKIPGAFLHHLQGKIDKKKCLIIPIEGSLLDVTDKGIYLNIICLELTNKKGQTHIIKQFIPPDLYCELNTEQKNSFPIIGGLIEL